MKITIIAPGKLKEAYLRDAQAHFSKIISKSIDFEIVEVQDERNDVGDDSVKRLEGERILKRINPRDFVIALAIDGQAVSTEKLEAKIKKISLQDKKDITFVIGGSLGLSEEVLSRANLRISFSPMTFPHQVMRIILLELLSRLHL